MPRRKKFFNVDIGPSEFEEKVKEYFDKTDPKEWTWGGLYLYLGVGAKRFKELAQHSGYADGVDYAYAKMQQQLENRLKTNNSTGAMFALKNMGWIDEKSMKLQADVTVKVEDLLKKGKMRAK